MVGYIPDMIFDKELDYLAEIGVTRVAAGVELGLGAAELAARTGRASAWCMTLRCPFAPELVRVLPDEISLTRTFWLIRHADDARVEPPCPVCRALLATGMRREVEALEGLGPGNDCLTGRPYGRDAWGAGHRGRMPCWSARS